MTLAPRLYDCSSRTASDVHSEPYADVLASNRSTTTLFSQFRSQMPEPSQLLHELVRFFTLLFDVSRNRDVSISCVLIKALRNYM